MSYDLMSKRERAELGLALFLFILLVAADQLAKFTAADVFRNRDFAFSLQADPYLMYAVYAVAVLAVVNYLFKSFYKLRFVEVLSWVLILAGGLSNLAERIALGYVRDFIYLGNGVLNFADFYIIAGVAILLGRELLTNKPKLTQ